MTNHILSIAGTDPTSGAGIQADLKTISALGAYAFTVTTAVLAQNTCGVRSCHALDPHCVGEQIDAVFEDTHIHAVKIGMVASQAIIAIIAQRLLKYRPSAVVFDPVMRASSGHALLEPGAIELIRHQLLPLCTLVTPNLAEAALLLGCPRATTVEAMYEQAGTLLRFEPQWVLIKGGHLEQAEISPDLLRSKSQAYALISPRLPTTNTHGTSCTLSAAIATQLPHNSVPHSVQAAKTYLYGALAASLHRPIGRGRIPVHHFYQLWQQSADATPHTAIRCIPYAPNSTRLTLNS